MFLDQRFIETLIFNKNPKALRFTQDSPVFPDVWLDYYMHKDELEVYRADLILTPHKESSAAELFLSLSTSRKHEEPSSVKIAWEMATNGETVVAKLTLKELIENALPSTKWWQKYLLSGTGKPNEDFIWLRRLVGAIQYSSSTEENLDLTLEEWLMKFESIYLDYYNTNLLSEKLYEITLWSISRNRIATMSIEKSVPITKADASRRLFGIDGSKIAWAVMDTGIDARHTAFRKLNPETKSPYNSPMGEKEDKFSNNTRIIASYDFTNFRKILTDTYSKLQRSKMDPENIVKASSNKYDQGLSEMEIQNMLNKLQNNIHHGLQFEWSVIAPLLRIPHNNTEYVAPKHPHGTHVAGIIGANANEGLENSMRGMCPGIELYDIRVMDENGTAQEFNILAAIHFIRWLNSQNSVLTIQGVNMSFSMTHEVASYACGQTPVCVASERLVAEGTVVVAAAGNLGQSYFQGADGCLSQGFRTVNITDPGNAEKIITVGATHRSQPHAYGVSYFSSKGPTGDGRVKPDLVAPGEKIVSLSIDDGEERMDGTSMAAPHVSGAAALVMAKHRELIGKPDKIKDILCRTATDLGREKYFQGHGLVDVLRAIQYV